MNLLPEDLPAVLTEMQRQIQDLQVAGRVGLNRIRFAWTTHTGAPRVSTLDAYESGPVAATWQDDRGNTGTGYPQLTVDIGTKALVLIEALGLDVANEAGYNCRACRFGYGIDGAAPDALKPFPSRYSTHGPTTEGTHATQVITARNTFVPGSRPIGLWAKWTTGVGGGAAIQPYLYDGFLAVIPIN